MLLEESDICEQRVYTQIRMLLKETGLSKDLTVPAETGLSNIQIRMFLEETGLSKLCTQIKMLQEETGPRKQCTLRLDCS